MKKCACCDRMFSPWGEQSTDKVNICINCAETYADVLHRKKHDKDFDNKRH